MAFQNAKAAGFSDPALTRALHGSAAKLSIIAARYLEPSQAEAKTNAASVQRISSPVGLLKALEIPGLERLEVPLSIIDWRWRSAEVRNALAAKGAIQIHAYDIFLKGLLTSKSEAQWPLIDGVKPKFVTETLDLLTREFRRQSRADLCLAYVRGLAWVDGVLIDPASEEEWETITRLSTKAPLTPAECAAVEDILPRLPALLLNPSLWP